MKSDQLMGKDPAQIVQKCYKCNSTKVLLFQDNCWWCANCYLNHFKIRERK